MSMPAAELARSLQADAAKLQEALREAREDNPAITLLAVEKELSRVLAHLASGVVQK